MDTILTDVQPSSPRASTPPPRARLPGEEDFDPLAHTPRIEATDRSLLSPAGSSWRTALLATAAVLPLLGAAVGFAWHERARIEQMPVVRRIDHVPVVQRFAHLAAVQRAEAVAFVHRLPAPLPTAAAKPAPKTISGNGVTPPPPVHAQAAAARPPDKIPASVARVPSPAVTAGVAPAPSVPAATHTAGLAPAELQYGQVAPAPSSGKPASASPASGAPASAAARAELREFTALQPKPGASMPGTPTRGTSTLPATTTPAAAGPGLKPVATPAGAGIAPGAPKPVLASAQPATTPVAAPHPSIPPVRAGAGLEPSRASAPIAGPSPVMEPLPVARLAPAVRRDPVGLPVALRPTASTPREQIDLAHLMVKMGIVVRNLRNENAELRQRVGELAGEMDSKLTQFDLRLSLAEAKGAIAAAMGAGRLPADPSSATMTAERPPAKTGKPGAIKMAAAASQAAAAPLTAAAPPALVRSVKDYRIQAASPGLAMLSSVGLSDGETTSIQVAVGDDVPGVGRIKAIYQRGTRWVVQTDHGLIQ